MVEFKFAATLLVAGEIQPHPGAYAGSPLHYRGGGGGGGGGVPTESQTMSFNPSKIKALGNFQNSAFFSCSLDHNFSSTPCSILIILGFLEVERYPGEEENEVNHDSQDTVNMVHNVLHKYSQLRL